MSKILELLAFLNEPKTYRQVIEKFGSASNLQNLIKAKSVRLTSVANDNPEKKYSRFVLRAYVATGVEYKAKITNPSPRKDYYKQWRERRKSALADAASNAKLADTTDRKPPWPPKKN